MPANAAANMVLLNVPFLGQGYSTIDPAHNCGPATIAMALSYATGQSISTDTIRKQTKHPTGGATYFSDFVDLWPRYGLKLDDTVKRVYSAADFKTALDKAMPIVVAVHQATNWLSRGSDFGVASSNPAANRGLYDASFQASGWADMGSYSGSNRLYQGR